MLARLSSEALSLASTPSALRCLATSPSVYLAKTSSALPFNELRSSAGSPDRPRASLVALRPYRRERPGMLNRAQAVARALLAIFASRADLILENLALGQQLAVLRRTQPRPRLRSSDRLFWLALRRWWPRWEETLEHLALRQQLARSGASLRQVTRADSTARSEMGGVYTLGVGYAPPT